MTPQAGTAKHERARTSPGGKDYGYGNARLRGMRSRLLGRAYFEQLSQAPDLSHVISELSNTEYGPDLDETLIHGRTAAEVDEALKRNMVRTYRKVLGFLNEEARGLTVTLLGRWDLFNIKTIVRGKHMHLIAGEIVDSLIPVGQLSTVDLTALASVDDVKMLVDTAATWQLPYTEALREGYRAYMVSGDLADLELALDAYYSEWAAKRLSHRGANTALARRILGIQVDLINLITVFRLLKADVADISIERFFLRGGNIVTEEMYQGLSRLSDVDEMLDALRGTPYGRVLEDAAVAYIEEGSIAVFERALEDLLMRKAIGSHAQDPLGLGVVISYLWSKQNEVTNLRIVVKSIAVGMPVERMKKELILV